MEKLKTIYAMTKENEWEKAAQAINNFYYKYYNCGKIRLSKDDDNYMYLLIDLIAMHI